MRSWFRKHFTPDTQHSGQPNGAPELFGRAWRNWASEEECVGGKGVGGDGDPVGEVGGVLDVVADVRLAVELKDELAGWLAGKRGEGRSSGRECEKV